jgi:hypothetical protein
MSTGDERSVEARQADLEKAKEAALAKRLAYDACASIGKPIDEKDATKLGKHFASAINDLGPPMEAGILVGAVSIVSIDVIESIKPFNFTLNIRKFIEALMGGALAIPTAVTMPWLSVFAALYIFCTLSEAATIKLDERTASVLWTLWVKRDRTKKTVPYAGLLRAVNEERKKYGHGPISRKDLNGALHYLEDIHTIKRHSRGRIKWWHLREVVFSAHNEDEVEAMAKAIDQA